MAQGKPRRWLLWILLALWLSDWLLRWTAWLGFAELGFWLWLIGLAVFVFRSVIDTKLPEWLLTWAWMLGLLAVWMIEAALLGDLGRSMRPVSSDAELAKLLASSDPKAVWLLLELAATADTLVTGAAVGVLGWAIGVVYVHIGGVVLSAAFMVRRQRLAHAGKQTDPPPVFGPRERAAHRRLVVLQAPLFAIAITMSIGALSAGIVLLRGAVELSSQFQQMVGPMGWMLLLGGFAGFVLGVLELRQLMTLRWCGRVRLAVAAVVPVLVLIGLVIASLDAGPGAWLLVAACGLWCVIQLSAVRTLWLTASGRTNTR